MTTIALISASGLVVLALLISNYHKVGLERDILIGIIRATLQLLVVGYVLQFVFSLNDWKYTTTIITVMIMVAGANAAKRGEGIKNVFLLVTMAIAIGSMTTLVILVTAGVIAYRPMEAIPISGMIVGNAMVASGLTLKRIKEDTNQRRMEIITALTLGAGSRQAISTILTGAIRTGMLPTIDSMKTLGIVQLPGMMTGLILGGADPVKAVKYQLLVTFMLSSATAISCTIVGLLAYRTFFNEKHQFLLGRN